MAAVSAAMAPARDPWWVIGSAAVALHLGQNVGVGDVDVLLSVHDAESLADRLRLTFAAPDSHHRFRSTRFLTWKTGDMSVEFMADLSICPNREWRAVRLATRERMAVGGGAIFIPARDELRALLRDFGRPKDVARAALL